MQVKSFKEWDTNVNEMAFNNDISGDSLDRTKEWKTITSISQFTKLVSDKISANKYKLYINGTETYYLTDKDDNYLGHLELESGRITGSYSKIKGGFYTLMFTQIFAHSGLKQILSDDSLSPAAIRSYEKLATTDNQSTKNFKVNILINNTIVPFDREVLLSSGSARVVLSENVCKCKVDSFIHRIQLVVEGTNGYPGHYKKMWLENNPYCDMWLYGEHIIY